MGNTLSFMSLCSVIIIFSQRAERRLRTQGHHVPCIIQQVGFGTGERSLTVDVKCVEEGFPLGWSPDSMK